jgi:hypothetical protein
MNSPLNNVRFSLFGVLKKQLMLLLVLAAGEVEIRRFKGM